MTFDLPMPPSVNHYWRHGRNGTYLSDEGRKYRAEVLKRIKSPVVLYPHQRLAVTIVRNRVYEIRLRGYSFLQGRLSA